MESKLISDYGHISSYEANLERRTGKITGALYKGTRGFLQTDAGSGTGFTARRGLHRHGSRYISSPFLYDVALEKRGFG